MVLTFPDYEIIAGITNYFRVEFLKISFYLNLFVKMEFFRQKERIQVIKYIYLLKKKKKLKRRRRLRLGHISSRSWKVKSNRQSKHVRRSSREEKGKQGGRTRSTPRTKGEYKNVIEALNPLREQDPAVAPVIELFKVNLEQVASLIQKRKHSELSDSVFNVTGEDGIVNDVVMAKSVVEHEQIR